MSSEGLWVDDDSGSTRWSCPICGEGVAGIRMASFANETWPEPGQLRMTTPPTFLCVNGHESPPPPKAYWFMIAPEAQALDATGGSDSDLSPGRVREVLEGRTIVRAELEPVPDESFPQGNDLTLWLDDGSTVCVSGWGYDSFGTTVSVERAESGIREEQA